MLIVYKASIMNLNNQKLAPLTKYTLIVLQINSRQGGKVVLFDFWEA